MIKIYEISSKDKFLTKSGKVVETTDEMIGEFGLSI